MNRLSQLLVVSFVLSAGTLNAQQIFLNDASRPVNRTAERKKAFERELVFLIGDMQRTCKLTEAQVKKLRVASKGAVASAMEKFEKQQKQMQAQLRQAGMNLPGLDILDEEEDDDAEAEAEAGNDEDKDDDEDEEAEPDQPEAALFNMLAGNVLSTGGSQAGSVTKEPRWVKSVEKVLSKEQLEKYATAVEKRAAFARKSAVDAFIAKVDLKLLLSLDQRKKLTTLVDEEFGKQMAKRLGTSNRSMFFLGARGGRQTPPIAHEEIKPLFSEAQFAEWKKTFENELNQFKPQRGLGGGFGNVIIQGAPAIQEIRIEARGDDN